MQSYLLCCECIFECMFNELIFLFLDMQSISTPDQPSSSKETPYTGSGESSGVSPQETCASNSNVNPLYQDAILNNITSKLGTIMSPLPKIWDIITDYSNSVRISFCFLLFALSFF